MKVANLVFTFVHCFTCGTLVALSMHIDHLFTELRAMDPDQQATNIAFVSYKTGVCAYICLMFLMLSFAIVAS